MIPLPPPEAAMPLRELATALEGLAREMDAVLAACDRLRPIVPIWPVGSREQSEQVRLHAAELRSLADKAELSR